MENAFPLSPVYRGRFAPSPTGPLHFGSLVTAVGSYLEARSRSGEWLVRIENLDRAREIPGASEEILNTLHLLGMEWDAPVVYQEQRQEIYHAALSTLEKRQLIYRCSCSRKEIADSSVLGIEGPVYPGTCRYRKHEAEFSGAWRLYTNHDLIEFEDGVQGIRQQRIQRDIGDFVICRADGVFAYQLAVVVDDAEQGITHVVRGGDLLNSTPRQIHLQKLLGYSIPSYMHLPVVVNARGEKLSKQTQATPVDISHPVLQLVKAIRFLGQTPPPEVSASSLRSFWIWAIENWNREAIPKNMSFMF
ncbi:MAG: Glutamate--tRNA ligase [Nitrosospira multiformis]|nr:Glutamate--tRNA ligase [Nitrosospira multiformis]